MHAWRASSTRHHSWLPCAHPNHTPPLPLFLCSLPQPHLDRTKLCELDDAQLDKRYVTQRDGLRTVVQDRAKAKVVGGQQLTGKTLARLLQSLISALNAKEIPTGASLIDSFNREIVAKALQLYVAKLDAAVKLPVDADALEQVRACVGRRCRRVCQCGAAGVGGSHQLKAAGCITHVVPRRGQDRWQNVLLTVGTAAVTACWVVAGAGARGGAGCSRGVVLRASTGQAASRHPEGPAGSSDCKGT